jgi:hypothetical protein
VLVVAASDAVVAVGGGAGTLTEMAMAWQLRRIIVGLLLDGWSGRLAGSPLDAQRSDVVLAASDAEEAIQQLRQSLTVGWCVIARGIARSANLVER